MPSVLCQLSTPLIISSIGIVLGGAVGISPEIADIADKIIIEVGISVYLQNTG